MVDVEPPRRDVIAIASGLTASSKMILASHSRCSYRRLFECASFGPSTKEASGMNTRKHIALGLGAGVLVLGAVAGVASGSRTDAGRPPGSVRPGTAGVGSPARPAGRPGPATDAMVDYLGLTGEQIRAEVGAGKTLAQIASAAGKTVSGLEDAIVGDAKSHLDAAVVAGQLTPAQEASLISAVQAHVAATVNATGSDASRRR
jgi:hypothetical protein